MKPARIARGSEEIGEMSLMQIKDRIADGELTLGDWYFDPEVGDWCKLECLPDLAEVLG